MMKILAIDTSSHACSIALLDDHEITSKHEIAKFQQAKLILTWIQALLESKNILLNQLDAIAFGCGPGSFTGVRIAASVSQGLAYGLKIPIIGISSLAALAHGAYQDLEWKKCFVAIDARAGEIYSAHYRVDGDGFISLVGAEIVSKPAEIVIPHDLEWAGVGNAWDIYREQIPYQPIEIDATRNPAASSIAVLAKIRFQNQDYTDASDAMPVYLRDSIAKKNNEAQLLKGLTAKKAHADEIAM